MRRLPLAVLAISVLAAPALAETAPLHPASTPSLGDRLGFTTGSSAMDASAVAAEADTDRAQGRIAPGQTVRDASGHVVGKVVRIANSGGDEVLVRGSGGKLSRVHVESFGAEGDAWLGGPQDLQDPRLVWY
ncbi:MAG: hypothetical protein JSR45_08740 [Proteobacteria bacterium]|nr:hypothetical protein [Pseudomonadota bacterium]